MNRAIRAECPGGAEVLDLLTLCHKVLVRPTASPDTKAFAQTVRDALVEVVHKMEDDTRKRHGMNAE